LTRNGIAILSFSYTFQETERRFMERLEPAGQELEIFNADVGNASIG